MANIIELESSYKINNFTSLLKKITEKGYKYNYHVIECDTYYTDKDYEFIKDRVCLRTRKTNNNKLELTFKPKTDDTTEKYGKKEFNISLDVRDYDDIDFVLNKLGYKKYVSFKKDREVYSKIEKGFEHNIMLDEIDGVGKYIELEIIANTEDEKEKLHNELDRFISEFDCNNLVEKKKSYRDTYSGISQTF